MTRKRQTPHRHHYLPQFYLKGFSGYNKQVCAYDKANKVNPFSFKSPKSIGFEKDLYELLVVEEADPMMIENELGMIEARAKHVFERLERQEYIEADELQCLADYIALQLVRTPKMLRNSKRLMEEIESLYFTTELRNAILDSEGLRKSIDEAIKQGLVPNEEFDEGRMLSMQDQALRGEIGVDMIENKENVMTMSLEQAESLSQKWLHYGHFVILNAPTNEEFVTSDHPLISFAPYGGYAHPGSMLFFPLSKSQCLNLRLIGSNELVYSSAENKLMDILNANQVLFSERYVIGSSRTILEETIGAYESLKLSEGR